MDVAERADRTGVDVGIGQMSRCGAIAVTTSRAGVAMSQTGERLDAVRRYAGVEPPTDGSFDLIAQMAALIFETPMATVSIVDTDRVWFLATQGLDGVREIGDEPGLCTSAILATGPYVVNDAAVDPRTLDHPLVRGELGLRAARRRGPDPRRPGVPGHRKSLRSGGLPGPHIVRPASLAVGDSADRVR